MSDRHKFRSERKRLQLTQGQLAKKLKISRVTIVNWECGHSRPQRRLVAALLKLGFSEQSITALMIGE